MQRLMAALATFCLALGTPFDSAAQTSAKLPRVAYVWLFGTGPSAPYHEPFRKRMEELGWREGQTFRAEYYDAKADPAKLDAIMEELARSKVDVIVAMCTPEARAAKKATSTIPIVVAAAGDLAAAGLVSNFAKPGGNITGMSAVLLPLSAKRVELLKQSFPNIKRATVLWNPTRPDNAPEVATMQKTARELGFELRSVEVRTSEELQTALEMLSVDGTDAILNSGDTLLSVKASAVVRRASELRVPGMYESHIFPELGGLMSYGPDFPLLHRRAADYVDRILRGAKPGDLPIEQPTRFELVINRKAARQIGVELPAQLVFRADRLID